MPEIIKIKKQETEKKVESKINGLESKLDSLETKLNFQKGD